MIGKQIRIKGYSGAFVCAGIREQEGRVDVRSLNPDDAERQTGHFGSNPIERYLRFGVAIEDVTLFPGDTVPPGVVTRLIHSADANGSYKCATIAGERFPLTAFHDPDWRDFIDLIEGRGYIIPPDTLVEVGVATDHFAADTYRFHELAGEQQS